MLTVSRWEGGASPALSAIARACGLHVDVEAERARAHARLWVAWQREQPVALLLAWHVADELQILDLGTDPGQRRQGAASALLGVARQYAERHGLRRIALEVRCSNAPALALYAGHGYAPFSRRRDYYSDPTEDALELQLELAPAGSD